MAQVRDYGKLAKDMKILLVRHTVQQDYALY